MTTEVTDTSFAAEVLQSDQPVLVDFWAPWCGPCRAMAPTFESLATEYEGRTKFVKVNIDETTLAQQYSIRSVPTLMLFKNGAPVDVKVGNAPRQAVAALVEAHLQ